MKNKFSICIVTSLYETSEGTANGIAKHFRDFSESLAENGTKIEILFVNDNDLDKETYLKLPRNIKIKWICRELPLNIEYSLMYSRRRLAKIIKNLIANVKIIIKILKLQIDKQIDLIETSNADYLCLAYSFIPFHLPIITRVSTTAFINDKISSKVIKSRLRPIEIFLENLFIKRSNVLVTHTRFHEKELKKAKILKNLEFNIIAHGTKADNIYFEENKINDYFNAPALYVGRLEYRKGIDVLINALKYVLIEFPNFILRVVGPGNKQKYESQLIKIIGAKYKNSVKFLGYLSTQFLQNEYKNCSFLIAPSRYESFGLVYIEAMKYGKPVIGTSAGGIPEVVREGHTGLIAKPGDSKSLAEKILILKNNKEIYRRLSHNAYVEVKKNFCRNIMVQKTSNLYNKYIT